MRHLFIFSIIIALLSGCATQSPPVTQDYHKAVAVHYTPPTDKLEWDMQGAVSIQNHGQTQMGSFRWQQVNDRYAINFFGPLNLGAIGIAGTPRQVVLNKPTGSYSAPNAEALMQQQLGWYLPVSNLYYWMRAIPAPGIPNKQKRDTTGKLRVLQQQGWQIRYLAFDENDRQDLPRSVVLENQSLRVKLVIKSWTFS